MGIPSKACQMPQATRTFPSATSMRDRDMMCRSGPVRHKQCSFLVAQGRGLSEGGHCHLPDVPHGDNCGCEAAQRTEVLAVPVEAACEEGAPPCDVFAFRSFWCQPGL